MSLEPTKEKERKRERMNGWISGKGERGNVLGAGETEGEER